jgi:hypothetical protein
VVARNKRDRTVPIGTSRIIDAVERGRVAVERTARALPHSCEPVIADGEQPPPGAPAWLEGVPRPERAEIRLLNEILRVFAIAHQGQRKPEDVVEPAQRFLLEPRVRTVGLTHW